MLDVLNVQKHANLAYNITLRLLFLYTRHDMFEFPSTDVPYLRTSFCTFMAGIKRLYKKFMIG